MTAVTNIRPLVPALPDVVGYVEACTADRLLGWAWAPASPDTRVVIELRLGDGLVSSAVADLPRADLGSNGIGDGRHAFDIDIPSEFRGRTAELRVFARAADGAAIPIGAPPPAEGVSDQVTKLLRGMEMLVNSQRLIHRNLQTALTAPKDSEASSGVATLSQMAKIQAGTEAQLAAIERFVVRLDEHLSRLAPEGVKAADKPQPVPAAALWALGAAASAFIISIVGLVRSLGG